MPFVVGTDAGVGQQAGEIGNDARMTVDKRMPEKLSRLTSLVLMVAARGDEVMSTAAAVLPRSFEKRTGTVGWGRFTSQGITPQAECHTDRRRAETIMETDVFLQQVYSSGPCGSRRCCMCSNGNPASRSGRISVPPV